jgi:hypothetical protein
VLGRFTRMALLLRGKTECALCGEVIGVSDEVFGTPHFIGDSTDPLFRFSDAALHRRCFETWQHHDEFLARYEKWCRAVGRLP